MSTVNDLMDRAMSLRIAAAKIVDRNPVSLMEISLDLIGAGFDADDIHRMFASGLMHGADCIETDAHKMLGAPTL